MDLRATYKLRQQLLSICTGANLKDYNTTFEEKLDQILKGALLGGNRFLTIFDFHEYRFEYVSDNMKELLGYSSSEFTIINLFGKKEDNAIGIIHPDDRTACMRSNTIICGITFRGNYEIRILRDHYIQKFRIKTKNNKIKTISRDFYLFALDNQNRPKYHLDIWTVGNGSFQTSVELDFQPMAEYEIIFFDFYLRNIQLLDFHFTPKESQILHEKSKSNTDQEVANNLGIDLKSVQNFLANMKRKAKIFLTKRRSNVAIKTTNDLLLFSMKYHLIPVPELFMELEVFNRERIEFYLKFHFSNKKTKTC